MASRSVLSTSFTSSTTSGAFTLRQAGEFNILLDFTTGTFVGTATLQRSYDGSTWYNVTDAQGNVASWTADLNTAWFEPEAGVQYRWNVTRTSGTLATRLSQ